MTSIFFPAITLSDDLILSLHMYIKIKHANVNYSATDVFEFIIDDI